MICPLMVMMRIDPEDCQEELCGWWGDKAKKCGIRELEAIAINLAHLVNMKDEEFA